MQHVFRLVWLDAQFSFVKEPNRTITNDNLRIRYPFHHDLLAITIDGEIRKSAPFLCCKQAVPLNPLAIRWIEVSPAEVFGNSRSLVK